eukprot:GHVT01073797.1.p1 GENE.GHVT01073797.1~~GHVT01073797.1.p1  ORF type:complete len:559 (+),score=78.24 GHVT01073797.1:1010-2686(+)
MGKARDPVATVAGANTVAPSSSCCSSASSTSSVYSNKMHDAYVNDAREFYNHGDSAGPTRSPSTGSPNMGPSAVRKRRCRAVDSITGRVHCKNRDLCTFAHSVDEVRLNNQYYKMSWCKELSKKGHCPEGLFCSYAHTKNELLGGKQYYTELCRCVRQEGKKSNAECANPCKNPNCMHAHSVYELRAGRYTEEEIQVLRRVKGDALFEVLPTLLAKREAAANGRLTETDFLPLLLKVAIQRREAGLENSDGPLRLSRGSSKKTIRNSSAEKDRTAANPVGRLRPSLSHSSSGSSTVSTGTHAATPDMFCMQATHPAPFLSSLNSELNTLSYLPPPSGTAPCDGVTLTASAGPATVSPVSSPSSDGSPNAVLIADLIQRMQILSQVMKMPKQGNTLAPYSEDFAVNYAPLTANVEAASPPRTHAFLDEYLKQHTAEQLFDAPSPPETAESANDYKQFVGSLAAGSNQEEIKVHSPILPSHRDSVASTLAEQALNCSLPSSFSGISFHSLDRLSSGSSSSHSAAYDVGPMNCRTPGLSDISAVNPVDLLACLLSMTNLSV